MNLSAALVVNGIIALVLVEFVLLGLYRAVRKQGMRLNELCAFLGAGLGLLLALRVIVANGSFALLALALVFALVMHLWHVRQRWH